MEYGWEKCELFCIIPARQFRGGSGGTTWKEAVLPFPVALLKALGVLQWAPVVPVPPSWTVLARQPVRAAVRDSSPFLPLHLLTPTVFLQADRFLELSNTTFNSPYPSPAPSSSGRGTTPVTTTQSLPDSASAVAVLSLPKVEKIDIFNVY